MAASPPTTEKVAVSDTVAVSTAVPSRTTTPVQRPSAPTEARDTKPSIVDPAKSPANASETIAAKAPVGSSSSGGYSVQVAAYSRNPKRIARVDPYERGYRHGSTEVSLRSEWRIGRYATSRKPKSPGKIRANYKDAFVARAQNGESRRINSVDASSIGRSSRVIRTRFCSSGWATSTKCSTKMPKCLEDTGSHAHLEEQRRRERSAVGGSSRQAAVEYLRRLVQHGFRVSICEQTEDPKLAKGIVKREVVERSLRGRFLRRFWTAPANYLCALNRDGDSIGIAAATFRPGAQTDAVKSDDLESALSRFTPREVIVARGKVRAAC